MSDLDDVYDDSFPPADERELEARDRLRQFFDRNREEFLIKIKLCESLGIKPVFVCRMLPRSWIYDLNNSGGFALILKYQLYPWTHKVLAKRVSEDLKLPVDAPRFLAEGTMNRFLKWHRKNLVNLETDSRR